MKIKKSIETFWLILEISGSEFNLETCSTKISECNESESFITISILKESLS
jgi:hypothetical protein